MTRNPLLCLLSLAALATSLRAQGTLEDYRRAERFLPRNVRKLVFEAEVTPHWIGKTSRFWYRNDIREEKEFWLVDPARNTRIPAFDHGKLAEALHRATSKQYSPVSLPFNDFDLVENESAIRLEAEGARWSCQLKDYHCSKIAPHQSAESPSPDGQWSAFVKAHNLFLRYLPSGQEVQVTRDGERWNDYAAPLPSLRVMIQQETQEVHQPAAVFWSPNSKKLVTYRLDSRNAARFPTVQFVPPGSLRPRLYTYAYPLPGEQLAKAYPFLYEVESGKQIPLDVDPLNLFFQGGPDFTWFDDSEHFYFRQTERGYGRVEVREVDASAGKSRVLVSEESPTYVDVTKSFMHVLKGSHEILWSSERDGWNHVYLYDGKTAKLESQVTKGPWVVRSIAHVDEKNRVLYFTAAGREVHEDPYQVHLYRIRLDGTGLQLLTPGDANHTVNCSPDGEFFVDAFSRPDFPPVSELRRTSDDSLVRPLERADISLLTKTGWQLPEPFHAKGRDGQTDIYGLIWRPSSFHAGKKYPVIEQIYTGPQGFFVPKTFAAYRNSAQSTAELGFIVVMIDGQGTNGRSRKFHEFSYRNLGDGGIDDHIAVLRQMAARYPYIDLTQVGIYGGSAGGYDAAHALLTHPDFYKVGVSISGNHDQRLDKAWWNELWMGYPVTDIYAQQSNVTLAERLKGHLLLIHGDIDDNVHPVETLRLVDGLIRANKDFDLLLVPNMQHGEGNNSYVIQRRWNYFVRHLAGLLPPEGFEIKTETDSGGETCSRP